MKKIAVFIADGTEELEALTPVDILRRTGAKCDIISVNGEYIKSSHGITIKADAVIDSVDLDNYDALIIPGGMPGATNISSCEKAVKAIKKAIQDKKLVSAICASPAVVLADNGLLSVDKATCYPAPDFINSLGEKYTGTEVEVCENVITANGPKSAFKFALTICEKLNLTPKF